MKAEIPDRTYFKIGEVASILGVKPHIVRYWTDEFPQIRLQKTKSGQRLFRRRDIEMLLAIDFLINEQEFTVSGAKTRLKELRAIGVKNKDLRQTMRRLASIDVIKSIVLNEASADSAAQSVDASHTNASSAAHVQEQASLGFVGRRPSTPADDAHHAERNEDAARAQEAAHLQRIETLEKKLKEERDAYERRIELYKQSVVEERQFFADEQKILTLYIEELEESLHQAQEARAKDAQEREQEFKRERDAFERRIELYKQSVVEERQFFADEQKILTLYIEELEQSLYKEKVAHQARLKELKAADTHTETLRAQVRTHAMQHRYALRNVARDAKQHKEMHARARELAQRLVDRVHAQRQLTGHETHNDSD